MIRKEILSSNLNRPSWISQDHRSLDRLWLDKNECADPEMNGVVVQSLSKISGETVFSYPDLDILYQKVAIFANVSPENILLTSGSDGAIRACFELCIASGDKVILTRPTFAMYGIYSKIYGAEVTWVDYEASENGPVLTVDKFISTIEKIKPKILIK